MPPVGFEPTVSAGKRPQTYALDCAATGTGCMLVLTLITHHKLNTRYNRTQYRFPVSVQLMEVLKAVAVIG